MAYGDGSITKVKSGVWKVRLDLGKDPITKKRIIESRNVKGTKAEARKVRDETKAAHEQGLVAKASDMSFGAFANEWSQRRSEGNETTKDTAKKEQGIVDVICEYIKDVSIKDVTPRLIDTLYLQIRKDRGICGTTLQGYHQVLNMIMKQAVDYDIILRNPCDRVKTPRRDAADRRSLTQEEAARLLVAIDECEQAAYEEDKAKEERQQKAGNTENRTRLYDIKKIACAIATRVGLATGARRGEILALTWDNLDLESGTMQIVASLNKTDGVKCPKTRAGVRKVSLDAATVASLKRWRAYQEDALARLDKAVAGDTPVFTNGVGDYIDPSGFSRWWRKFKTDNGFPDLRFHELRHTQATVLLANNVDIKTVQSRLGHANASITLNLYAHAVPQNDREAADLVGSLFSKKQSAKEKGPLKKAV